MMEIIGLLDHNPDALHTVHDKTRSVFCRGGGSADDCGGVKKKQTAAI